MSVLYAQNGSESAGRGFRLASRMVAALASHALWAGIRSEPGTGGGESISIGNGVVPMDLFDDRICILSAEVGPLQQVFEPAGFSTVSEGQGIQPSSTSREPDGNGAG